MNSSNAPGVSTSPRRLPFSTRPEEGVPLRDASCVNARAIPSGESAIRRTRIREMSRHLSASRKRSRRKRSGSSRIALRSQGIPREMVDTRRLSRMRRASVSTVFAVIAACRFFVARRPRYMPPRASIHNQLPDLSRITISHQCVTRARARCL